MPVESTFAVRLSTLLNRCERVDRFQARPQFCKDPNSCNVVQTGRPLLTL
jgi:hypothetical protein